jgi:geranylgeranylglycerol-phosphate geranylgeranyltransferase
MPPGNRLGGLLELARPGNAVAAGVLTFTGAFVAGGSLADAELITAAVLATVFATAAGNAVNDYFDRDIDEINRPDRPIPRGAVSPHGAVIYAGALFVGAVGAALTLPPLAIAIAVVNLLALLAYTELFKGTPGVGNVVVAYLTGSTFLFGGAAVGRPWESVVLFVLAALATLTREIVKDVEDVAGDREEGLRTLPIVIGAERALKIGLIVLVVAVLASVVPYYQGTFGIGYVLLVVPADAVMLWGVVRAFEDPALGQQRIKRGTFLAAGAFVVGRLVSISGVTT